MARRIKRPEWWLLMLEMGDRFYPRNFQGDTKDLEKMERFGWYFWRPFLRKQNDSVQFSSMCVWACFHRKKHWFRCSALPKKLNHTSALFKVRCYTKPAPSTWKTQVQFLNHTSGWNGKTSFINLLKSSWRFQSHQEDPSPSSVTFHFSWLKNYPGCYSIRKWRKPDEMEWVNHVTLWDYIGNFPKSAKKLRELQSLLEHRDFWVLKQKPSSK